MARLRGLIKDGERSRTSNHGKLLPPPHPAGTRKGRMVSEVRETYICPLIEDGSISQGLLEKQNK